MKPGETITEKQATTGSGFDTHIESVNLHVNAKCNYGCKFCFARNLVRETMSPEQWAPYFERLWHMGIKKVNFAGGEPTLHPQFLELCSLAKEMGFVVSIVTNGSTLDKEKIDEMKGIVDWIGFSVDSPSNEIEKELGRQCGEIDHVDNMINMADLAHEAGMKVKLNITVVRQSWDNDFTDLIERIAPERLKAFKVTMIDGQNEKEFGDCSVTQEQWKTFVSAHENIILENGTKMVFEGQDAMIDSYLMLDPIARVMRNTGNKQIFLPFDALSEGLDKTVNAEKYRERGAVYEWGGSDE